MTARTTEALKKFYHIQDAIKVLVSISDNPSNYTEAALKTLCAALHLNTSKVLVRKHSEGDRRFSSVLKVLSTSTAPDALKRLATLFRSPRIHRRGASRKLNEEKFYRCATFRRIPGHVVAQFLYPFGLGLVLDFTLEYRSAIEIAEIEDKWGDHSPFSENLVTQWRVKSIFAASDTASDGPELSGYPSLDKALEAYEKEPETAEEETLSESDSESDDSTDEEAVYSSSDSGVYSSSDSSVVSSVDSSVVSSFYSSVDSSVDSGFYSSSDSSVDSGFYSSSNSSVDSSVDSSSVSSSVSSVDSSVDSGVVSSVISSVDSIVDSNVDSNVESSVESSSVSVLNSHDTTDDDDDDFVKVRFGSPPMYTTQSFFRIWCANLI